MLVLVDTNVLLRIAEPGHADHTNAVFALRRLVQAGDELCIVPQVHYEFWVAATRPVALNGLSMTTDEADAELRKLGPPIFRMLRDERAIYNQWRTIVRQQRVQGKRAHDARLVAAMLRHEVSQIITFNAADFQNFSEITVLDPRVFVQS